MGSFFLWSWPKRFSDVFSPQFHSHRPLQLVDDLLVRYGLSRLILVDNLRFFVDPLERQGREGEGTGRRKGGRSRGGEGKERRVKVTRERL